MTQIKICGITNRDDARVAIDAGADMLGFVLYPPSPRYREPAAVQEVIEQVKGQGGRLPLFVGVFVNESVENMIRIAGQCGLGAIQLHGAESNDQAQALRREGLRVFKAFQMRNAAAINDFDRFNVDGYVCDTPDPRLWGGTGQTFDHTLLAGASRRRRVILAGGLNAGNVAQALRIVQPWGVDVSSGVEAAPGKKDAEKIRAFVAAVKGAGAGPAGTV